MNLNNYNIELIKDLVSTQYGDYDGLIQIDGHSSADLSKLCKDHGVNTDKYFLIGLKAGEFTTTGIGKRNILPFMALVLDKTEYGESFDEIKKNIDSKSGIVKAKTFHFYVNYNDLGKYIKRFDFMVATKLTKYISEIKIQEEEL